MSPIRARVAQRQGYAIVNDHGETVAEFARIEGLQDCLDMKAHPPDGLYSFPDLYFEASAHREQEYFKEWSQSSGEMRDLRIERLSDSRIVKVSGCFIHRSSWSTTGGSDYFTVVINDVYEI